MKNSRLLQIFKCLNKKELRELRKFVNSPFHNQRADVILLFEYLLKSLKKSNSAPNLDKVKVFQQLFPKEAYDEKKIRYTMSFLFKTIQSFLTYQELMENPLLSQKANLQAMRKKGVKRLFDKAFTTALEDLEKHPFRHQEYHLQQYQLHQERYLFNTTQSRSAPLGLEEASNQLDQFFIANKLKQAALAFTHQRLNQSHFLPDLIDPVLAQLIRKDYFQNPAIVVYYHSLKILLEEDALPHFTRLRTLIKQHHHRFPKHELQEIYTFALNYCIKRLNAREGFFNREAFELYKEGLAQDVFFEQGMLSRFNYKNIVALGLGLEEFDWVANFIEAYKPHLDKNFRESTYCFNLALLHYKQQNYTEAMILLQKIETDDVLNNLNARRMLVRIYFDQGQLEPLYSLLDSFQNYIYRKKELGYHRELYLNFIRFTRRLLHLDPYGLEQLERLKREIEDTKNVVEKVWLLQQLGKR